MTAAAVAKYAGARLATGAPGMRFCGARFSKNLMTNLRKTYEKV